jgi:hypothetical protein
MTEIWSAGSWSECKPPGSTSEERHTQRDADIREAVAHTEACMQQEAVAYTGMPAPSRSPEANVAHPSEEPLVPFELYRHSLLPSRSPEANVARPSAEAKQDFELLIAFPKSRSSVPSTASDPGPRRDWPSTPQPKPSTISDPWTEQPNPYMTPQPKPSQAPYVIGLEQAREEAVDSFGKMSEKQGIRNLADLRGQFSKLSLAAGCQSEPGTARSRSGSDKSDGLTTSCSSKKSKSRAEGHRGPKRHARKLQRCRDHIEAQGGIWSDTHRADTAARALSESGSFKGSVARATYMTLISETNEDYVDEGHKKRVEGALIKEAGLIISSLDTKKQV